MRAIVTFCDVSEGRTTITLLPGHGNDDRVIDALSAVLEVPHHVALVREGGYVKLVLTPQRATINYLDGETP